MKRLLPAQFHQGLPFQGCLLALTLVLLTCWIRRTAVFSEYVELPLYDLVTRSAWPWKAGHPDVVLVAIQETDKGRWPLSDNDLARTLEKLLAAGPDVIGIDLLRDIYAGGNEIASARLKKIGTDDRLVWAETEASETSNGVEPPPFITELTDESERVGKSAFASFPMDGGPQPMVRRCGIAMWSDGSPRFSLAALLVGRHVGKTSPEIFDRLLGEVGKMPGNAGGYWLTDSGGAPANGSEFPLKAVRNPADCFVDLSLAQIDSRGLKIPVLALGEILDDRTSPELLRQALAGKIVILGTDSASLTKDEIPVVGDPALRGFKLHALATAQLLREIDGEAPIGFLSERVEDGFVLCACLLALTILGLPRVSPLVKGIGIVIALPLFILAAGYLFLKSGTWLPTGAPMLAGSATGLGGLMLLWRRSSNERTTYLKLMTAHLGPEVTAKVLARNDLLTAGMEKPPETFEATAFFADLRGYSGSSQYFQEKLTPRDFFSWLNGILRPAVEVTGRHGGFVKQFAGDGIFVIFGFPPETGGGHAQRAVDCALELSALIPTLNRDLPEHLPPYYMRIGIYTGDIHASSVGGGRHTDYSFLGPTTNKAARLESLDKERFDHLRHPVRILISGNTRRQLADSSNVTLYRDGPVQIDKNLPPEEIWIVSTQQPE